MIDRPKSRDQYPQRVTHIQSLVAAEDDDALAAELVEVAVHNEDVWRYDGAHIRMAVEVLSPARRHALILNVIDRSAAPPVAVDALLSWLVRGLGAGVLSWRAGRRLIDVAAASRVGLPEDLWVLAEVAVRETGEIPPGLLAVMRRTAKWMPTRAQPLRPWLEKAREPLNAGEPWAEVANAQAPAQRLLLHALGANGARPATGWIRSAKALMRELGVDECRALIHHWFTLVPLPRTIRLRDYHVYDTNQVLDPYNAVALRGLLYLLTAVVPHPDDPPAIGYLARHAAEKIAGHGARSQIVAYAAVHTLERLGTMAALQELQQLRRGNPQSGFAGRLDAAIARRSAALGTSSS